MSREITIVDKEYLAHRVREAREAISELRRLASKPYEELSVDERYSMRYQLIVLVEALGSVCYHLATEELGYEPKAYADCFSKLGELGLKCCDELVRMVRLRHMLVHRYWTINDERLYTNVREDFVCVEEFLSFLRERYGVG